MSSNWYTVEYDENSVAWLVDEQHRRICLEHGMRLYVAGRLATPSQTEWLQDAPGPEEGQR
jgi:uncharacterized lipoprotein YddW (UPF0748 family)